MMEHVGGATWMYIACVRTVDVYWHCGRMPVLVMDVSFWSLDEVVGDLRIHGRPSVCMYVTLLLENRALLFSETLQLVRACKWEKMFQALF